MTERQADVIFIQEHKLRGKVLTDTKMKLKKAGWTLMCGPCDDSTNKPNAGVGALVRDDAGVTVTRGKVQTDEYLVAYDQGRAAKYHVDANWQTEAMCYIMYGQVGGRKSDKGKPKK